MEMGIAARRRATMTLQAVMLVLLGLLAVLPTTSASRLTLINLNVNTAGLSIYTPCDSIAVFPCTTTELDMSQNIITSIPADALVGLTNFRILIMADNLLSTLPATAALSTTLQELNLTRNLITSIPSGRFANLSSIQRVDFSSNLITSLVANAYTGASAMATIIMKDMTISEVAPTAFSGLTSLLHLDLTNNLLSTLPGAVFSTTTSMQQLVLARNIMTVFPVAAVSTVASLLMLDISFNIITEIPAGTFTQLVDLENLNMNGNRLSALPDNTLSGPRFLRAIFLQSNRITLVGNAVFSGIAVVQELFIYNNSIATFEWMSQPSFVVRVLAWKPQRVSAWCAYNVTAIDSARPCDIAIGLNSTSPRNILTGANLPSNHICTDEGTCKSYFGANTTSCCDSDDSCRQCAVSGSPAAQRCVTCTNNPCFASDSTQPAIPWIAAGTAPLFANTALSAAPPAPPPVSCPLAACRRTLADVTLQLLPVVGELDRSGTDVKDSLNSNLTIGIAYRFAPPNWAPFVTADCGPAADLQFNVVIDTGSNASTGFDPRNEVLVTTTTGFVLVLLSHEFTATVQLVADAGFGTGVAVTRIVMATWNFTGHEPDITEIVVSSDPTLHPEYGPGGQDCENGLRVDDVRYDRAFTCDCRTSGFTGNRCEIVDQTNFEQLQIDTNYEQFIPAGEVESDFESYNRTKWAFGKTYAVAPFNLTRAYTENPLTARIASYQLDFGALAPRGFFVDGANGEILIKIPQKRLNLTARLLVESEDTRSAVAANLTFTVLPADVDNTDAVGPNGQPCLNGGSKTDVEDGESEFDLRYGCDCVSSFGGENCEIDSAAAATAQGSSDSANAAFAAIGAIVVILLAVLAVSRYLIRRARLKPEDMGAMQAGILDSLGLGGAAMNVNPDEIGFSLSFGSALLPSSGIHTHEMDDDLAASLLASLRQLGGLPSRLSKMLKDPSTVVSMSVDDDCALLRLKVRQYVVPPGDQEQYAAALQAHAGKNRISIDNTHYVVDVSVAVPARIPREIDRHSIVRLGMLGEGNFGEVFKASLQGTLSVTAAIKTLKVSDGTGRAELLGEAALMALFNHPNVVQLLGVVTVPRNMPALLVIEYCEHGTLLEHARKADQNNVDNSRLLTYCRDVSCGMHFLSSRRVVHRDLASRNILLDAGYNCKISDFGMSAALAGGLGDSDYASNYVRLKGELPVRWSSIEVLLSGKYSRASDVWSFGIMVYEVMSRGGQPYGDIATLAEVAERIKVGKTMSCPQGCPESVHRRIMLACWNAKPESRPGFAQLSDILEDLGASRSDAEAGKSATLSKIVKRHSIAVEDEATWKAGLQDRRLLGPSVHHINEVLAPAVVQAVQPPWKDSEGSFVDPPTNATIAHAVTVIVKPASANVSCPRDGKRGCAYVDTLAKQDDVGRATALLSYTWSYRIKSVGSALQSWVTRTENNPKRIYIWICSLCLNQHRMLKAATPDELAAEFGPRVQAIGRVFPMLEPWSQPTYLTRAWCLFELNTAIGERSIEIDVILTDEQYRSFLEAMSTQSYSCIDEAFRSIKSQDAVASEPADLRAIQTLIKNQPGGFEVLNTTVRQHLGRWFESHGAVKSASRVPNVARASATFSISQMSNRSELSMLEPNSSDAGAPTNPRKKFGKGIWKSKTSNASIGSRKERGSRRAGVSKPLNAPSKRRKKVGSGKPTSPFPQGLNEDSTTSTSTVTTKSRKKNLEPPTGPSAETPTKSSAGLLPAPVGRSSVTLPPTVEDEGYLNVLAEEPVFSIGDRVDVPNRGLGTVRFVGQVRKSLRVGIALDENRGLNDGSAYGTQYFACPADHGVFSTPETLTKISIAEPSSTGDLAGFGFGI